MSLEHIYAGKRGFDQPEPRSSLARMSLAVRNGVLSRGTLRFMARCGSELALSLIDVYPHKKLRPIDTKKKFFHEMKRLCSLSFRDYVYEETHIVLSRMATEYIRARICGILNKDDLPERDIDSLRRFLEKEWGDDAGSAFRLANLRRDVSDLIHYICELEDSITNEKTRFSILTDVVFCCVSKIPALNSRLPRRSDSPRVDSQKVRDGIILEIVKGIVVQFAENFDDSKV